MEAHAICPPPTPLSYLRAGWRATFSSPNRWFGAAIPTESATFRSLQLCTTIQRRPPALTLRRAILDQLEQNTEAPIPPIHWHSCRPSSPRVAMHRLRRSATHSHNSVHDTPNNPDHRTGASCCPNSYCHRNSAETLETAIRNWSCPRRIPTRHSRGIDRGAKIHRFNPGT